MYLQLYWAGPILGGVTASLLYTMAFSAPEREELASDKYRVVAANEKEVNSPCNRDNVNVMAY